LVIQLTIAVGLAVTVSALCSILEAVLYSVPNSHVEILKKNGQASGKTLEALKGDIHKPITAILTLNTVANTMGAAVAGAAAAAVFGDTNLGWFSVAFTLTILIFSEILPKTIGVAYCRELAPWIALPIRLLVNILTPAIWFCQAIIRLIPRTTEETLVSAEEVLAIAALSHRAGEINTQEERVINNILQLKVKYVKDVMTPRTVTFVLDGSMSVAEARNYTDEWNLHSRVPIYNKDPDDIIGVILRRDVLLTAAEGMDSIKLTSLARTVHFVPESMPLSQVLVNFFEKKRHLFVVIDEYGSVTGVITLEDVIEEIVGEEIMDESDQIKDMRALAKKRLKEKVAISKQQE